MFYLKFDSRVTAGNEGREMGNDMQQSPNFLDVENIQTKALAVYFKL